jgi:hypothetical protein
MESVVCVEFMVVFDVKNGIFFDVKNGALCA